MLVQIELGNDEWIEVFEGLLLRSLIVISVAFLDVPDEDVAVLAPYSHLIACLV